MASKILSFICHSPGTTPGTYPAVSMAHTTKQDRKADAAAAKKAAGGHFTAIYENDRFVRFKYINNGQ